MVFPSVSTGKTSNPGKGVGEGVNVTVGGTGDGVIVAVGGMAVEVDVGGTGDGSTAGAG
jgi:hypothetical protein